jgi:glutaredoxin 3
MAGAEYAGGFLMAEVLLYGTRLCPYCIAARHLLRGKGVEFQDIAVDGDPALRRLIAERSGRTTVPQIWVGEQHIGGFTDLLSLERSGRLDPLLAKVGEVADSAAEQINGKEHKP